MTRQLEIIFYGLACFHKNEDGTYRVLFPDGTGSNFGNVTAHGCAVWVRGRTQLTKARWPWFAFQNDFWVAEPRLLEIHGLNATALDDSGIVGCLPVITDSDPAFAIDTNPEAIVQMTVDRGVLKAHAFTSGMILTQWMVEADERAAIEFRFGNYTLELDPGVTQVMLANVATTAGPPGTPDNHFRLYRKLGAVKTKDLTVPAPRVPPPVGGLVPDDPSDAYRPMTPRVDCSNAFDTL